MIEVIMKDYLKKKLNIDVYLSLPSPLPKKFISLEKIGSSNNNHLESSMFAVQSWAESMEEAAKLNYEVKKALKSMIGLKEIARVNINSDYNFTDEETKRFRYQIVVELNHY